MADLKYVLDDNVKQNYLELLHQLQSKDLKEVAHAYRCLLCVCAVLQYPVADCSCLANITL